MLFRFVTATMLLATIASVAAATADEQRALASLYRRGLSGDKAAVVECVDKLEAELKANPANQLARVYLGSAYTLRSRDLGYGPKKLQTLNHGVALMDEAVAAAPDDAKVRLVRALTSQSLPFFTGGAASSRRDFDLLAANAERAPQRFQENDLQLIFYNAALAAKNNGNRDRAATLLKEAVAHPADTALAQKVLIALTDL